MFLLGFKLDGLTCNACKKVSEKRIGAIKGVNSVIIDLITAKALVSAESDLSLEDIKTSLEGTPYNAVEKETL